MKKKAMNILTIKIIKILKKGGQHLKEKARKLIRYIINEEIYYYIIIYF